MNSAVGPCCLLQRKIKVIILSGSEKKNASRDRHLKKIPGLIIRKISNQLWIKCLWQKIENTACVSSVKSLFYEELVVQQQYS